MESVPLVVVTGVAALVPAVRRRAVPVACAVLGAGASTAVAALRGVEGIVFAVAQGDSFEGSGFGSS